MIVRVKNWLQAPAFFCYKYLDLRQFEAPLHPDQTLEAPYGSFDKSPTSNNLG